MGAGSVVAADAALLAARRYEPLGEIARGGTGRILRARDVVFDRIVALKTPIDPGGASRLMAEAAILAHLQHPSIMPVYDRGVFDDGMPFFAMKLVEGRSLRDVIAETPALDKRLSLIPQLVGIAEAISYAHSQGVIHRDLKPANVLVGTFGEVIVIDWGLAKLVAEEPKAPAAEAIARVHSPTSTSTGAVLGTPAYMAPEQARGEAVDARADVYALGALLYHLLAGSSPFSGRSGRDIIDTISREGPESIAVVQPRAPVDLAAIVQKAMALDPADRYPSARELTADLIRFQVGGLVGARRYSWAARARRRLRQHRGKFAAQL
jgi:serine/threonine protein kinase